MYLRKNETIQAHVEPKSKIGVKDFCEQTSIHGWSFISFSKFKTKPTIFWLVVILVAFSMCIAMIYDNAKEFNEATVAFQTVTLTESIENVFFPSIYISNKNAMRRSYIKFLMEDPNVSNITTLEELISLLVNKRFYGKLPKGPRENNILEGKSIIKV